MQTHENRIRPIAGVYFLILIVAVFWIAERTARAEVLTAGHCQALTGFYRSEFEREGAAMRNRWERANGAAASVYGAFDESQRRLGHEDRAFITHVLTSGSASDGDRVRMRRIALNLTDSFSGADQYRFTRCENWPRRSAESRSKDATKGPFSLLGSHRTARRQCTRDVGEIDGQWVAVPRFPFIVHEGKYFIAETIKPSLDRNIRFVDGKDAEGLEDGFGIEICDATSADGIEEVRVCGRIALRDFVRMGAGDLPIETLLTNNGWPLSFPQSPDEYARRKIPGGCHSLVAARSTDPRATHSESDASGEALATGPERAHAPLAEAAI